MSEENKALIKQFQKHELTESERTGEAMPFLPKKTSWGQRRDTAKIEAYRETVKAFDGVIDGVADLKKTFGRLDNIDNEIDRDTKTIIKEVKTLETELEAIERDRYLKQYSLEKEEKLIDLQYKLDQAKLEAQIVGAELEKATAKKGLGDLKAPKQPHKTQFEKMEEGFAKDQKTEMLELVEKKRAEDKQKVFEMSKELGWTEKELEHKLDLIDAKYDRIISDKLYRP